MASRLFRAVVGIGISLGTTSAACLGAVDIVPDAEDASSATSPPPTATAPPPPTPPEAGADVKADAAADAPADVILDAFCDATWPTTKGQWGGPTCGDVTACEDAGNPPYCWETVAPGQCTTEKGRVPVWCVGGNWQCSAGAIPEDECKCWHPVSGGPPCP